jgi:hypothetical protein
MLVVKEKYILKGKLIFINVFQIENKEIIVSEKPLKIARIKEEWDDDVNDPSNLIRGIKKNGVNADIFTFMQRLPESIPKFDYYMEWDNVAALPITGYDDWFENKIHRNHRNKIKLSKKKGVVIKQVEFKDELVKGIQRIYNETKIRQGRPYWNYGMNFENTKEENSQYLDRADFIGAYFKEELIGYCRIVHTRRFARTMGILSMNRHRDKAPSNALLAKAVEICGEKKVPYLIYAKYDYGNLGSDSLMKFKRYNGFESIILPRYFIPLTLKGYLALKLGLHKGVVGILPNKLTRILIQTRNSWYNRK